MASSVTPKLGQSCLPEGLLQGVLSHLPFVSELSRSGQVHEQWSASSEELLGGSLSKVTVIHPEDMAPYFDGIDVTFGENLSYNKQQVAQAVEEFSSRVKGDLGFTLYFKPGKLSLDKVRQLHGPEFRIEIEPILAKLFGSEERGGPCWMLVSNNYVDDDFPKPSMLDMAFLFSLSELMRFQDSIYPNTKKASYVRCQEGVDTSEGMMTGSVGKHKKGSSINIIAFPPDRGNLRGALAIKIDALEAQ